MGEGAGAIWGRCGSGSIAGVIAWGDFCPAGFASPEGGAAQKGAVRRHEVSGDGLGVVCGAGDRALGMRGSGGGAPGMRRDGCARRLPRPICRGRKLCFLCSSCPSLVSRGVVSVQGHPISKALGGEFSGVEQPRRGDWIANAMIKWTPSSSVSGIAGLPLGNPCWLSSEPERSWSRRRG